MKSLIFNSSSKFVLLAIFLAFSLPSFAITPEQDMLIQAGDVKIGGTLLVPKIQKVNQLVILSSGSGPQDRDETLFDFKIFKVIAERLAEQGIASFRYDDRGVGSSTGDFVNSTIDDLANDVEAIMAYFQASKTHPFKEFTLFGHSQGGIVVGKVAARNADVKKVVLMASPAVSIGDLVLSQLRLDYASSNLNIALVEQEVSSHAVLLRAVHDGKKIDSAVKNFSKSYADVLKVQSDTSTLAVSEIEKRSLNHAKEHKMVYGLPSLKSFVFYDPAKDLEKLNVPVLSLVGGLDAQVSIKQNKDRMENALLVAGVPYKFVVFEKANHFFQSANTGLKDEYDALDKAFVDGFLDSISSWIKQ